MTWTKELLYGAAQQAANAGIGVWRQSGAYTAADDCSISIGATLDEPVKSVALMAYSPVDSPDHPDALQSVQFAVRGTLDATSVDTIGDALRDLFHGRAWYWVADTILVVRSYRASVVPLGRDEKGRWQATHNYRFQIDRPAPGQPTDR